MIPKNITARLEQPADLAIRHALGGVALAFGGSVPQEPAFVAAIVHTALPSIGMSWGPILNRAGFSASFSGVFCHRSPIANFMDQSGNGCNCELADLLVVVEDLTPGGAGLRRAVLIQAKMASRRGDKTLTRAEDKKQLDLYSRWPPFELRSGLPRGQRDFGACTHPGTPADSGRYGLINRRTVSWHQRQPATTMPAGGDELGTFLARMVESRPGYGREATGAADGWSRTVDDLTRITFNRVFTEPRSKSKRMRGVSVAIAAISGAVSCSHSLDSRGVGGGSLGGESESPSESLDVGGISLLHVGIADMGIRLEGVED